MHTGLIYSFVARGSIVLAEYSPFNGNFNQVALECLNSGHFAAGNDLQQIQQQVLA